MSRSQIKKEQGFTIIEVVLVLAIAGLIFLIVFLALPQLQRSRRDTQRKSDAGLLLSSLESYAGNNNGAYPANVTDVNNEVVGTYIGDPVSDWKDPSSGNEYVVVTGTTPAEGEMGYNVGADCAGTGSLGARNIAVYVFQESGGSYCQDNR